MKSYSYVSFFTIILAFISTLTYAGSLDKAVDSTLQSQKSNAESQQAIDKMVESTRTMEQEYKTILRSMDGLVSYNDQLDKLVENQRQELESITRQLGYIEDTQREIVPLMLRMIEVLEQFIALDLPFLNDERQQRLQLIKDMMDRADVTLTDKFRRIMEAYQIEMEYGRTIEAYEDTISIGGKTQTVDILRIGRLNLLYSSLDQRSIGQWDPSSKQWVNLDAQYYEGIQDGLRIARNQAPPDLFKVPVAAPEAVQ